MAKVPTIGQMRMLLKFETPNKESDGTGGQNEQYIDLFICRGYFEEGRAFRTFETGYDQAVSASRAWAPWTQAMESNINKDMRVIYEARVFSVDTFSLVDQKRRIYKFELTEVR